MLRAFEYNAQMRERNDGNTDELEQRTKPLPVRKHLIFQSFP
jgi:hypothetical protein